MGFGRFMPREERFFDSFERNASNLRGRRPRSWTPWTIRTPSTRKPRV